MKVTRCQFHELNFHHKGVRTESWTAGRSGLEVRMYSREKVELFLLATEDGMGAHRRREVRGGLGGRGQEVGDGAPPAQLHRGAL